MKNKYLIDSNIFLHLYLEQDEESVCRTLLNKLGSGRVEAAVTLFHLDAAAIVMERDGLTQKEIAEFYARVYQSKGIEIMHLGVVGRLNGLADRNHSGIDDSLIEQALKDRDLDRIITYDTDFDEELRITPEEILQSGK
ncbi:MAG: hypothetical protein ABEJ95_00535 [Candidatus Nanohalobium sp.]